MGAKDSKAKEYLADNERFADLFNFFLKGKRIIKPEDLQELDTTEVLSVYGVEFKEMMAQKWRDLLKGCIIKTSPKMTMVILGAENQAEIHYAMPVKNLIYDALAYGKQVNAAAKKHEAAIKAGKEKRGSNAEFLSGFRKSDKLTPVLTLTVYWGADEWDGPRRLSDMFHEEDSDLLEYVPAYKLNLIVPNQIKDFSQFQTELGAVFEFLKYSKDENAIREVLQRNEQFRDMSYESASVINTYTGLQMKLKKGRRIDVCKAVSDMVERGKKEGRMNERQSIVINMFKMKMPIETIAASVNDTIENVKQMLASAGIAMK